MRSKVVKSLALVLLLGSVGVAQQPGTVAKDRENAKPAPQAKPKAPTEKSKLEGMLADALKNNPDIRVAAANVALADAELNRTRLQVTQKILTLYHAIQSQKATVEYEQKQYERMQALLKDQVIDSKLVDERSAKLAAAKAKLAELEAQIPGLLGKVARANVSKEVEAPTWSNDNWLYLHLNEGDSKWRRRTWLELTGRMPSPDQLRVSESMADKLRKSLARSISVDFKDSAVAQIVESLSRDSGIVIKYIEDRRNPLEESTTIRCDNISFGAVLQLLEDSLPGYSIVVRDYGLLITQSQSVPPGAISVQQFLRQKPAEK